MYNSTPLWTSGMGYTTRDHLYALVDGKSMVSEDVMDVYVVMLREGLKRIPCDFKRFASIFRPIALALSQKPHSANGLHNFIPPCIEEYPWWKWCLCP